MAARKSRDTAAASAEQAPDLSILGSTVTIHPSSLEGDGAGPVLQTKDALPDEDPSRNLISQMSRLRQRPFDFLREIGLYVSGQGWRGYDDIVGQPVFYPAFSDDMKARVLANEMLRDKVAELAARRVQAELDGGLLCTGNPLTNGSGNPYGSGYIGEGHHLSLEERKDRRQREVETQIVTVVDDMVDAMICKMDSKGFIRSAFYGVTSFLTRAYHQGIHVSSAEVLRLRSVAAEAAKNHHSIIFLPNHKSHIDYVSMQIICFRLGISLPTVVAGDNLNFPVVGPFLQHAGAMWIRRSFNGDDLYTTTVQAYIDTLLQNGYNFECFIEGGRSRTGKLLTPKFGILRFLLDSVLSGRVSDAIVCPVSTQYDKVIEVDSYVSELLGQPKAKENLADFLSASSILNLKLGRVDVRFHAPWSLRDFCQDQLSRYTNIPAHIDSPEKEWTAELRVRLLRTLGYKVLADINSVSVIMPTALIGTVLLTLRGRGVGKSELIRRVEWLGERVKKAGGRVAHFGSTPTETVVERGLEVLGPSLVGVLSGGKTVVEETYYAVDRFQLSFYRNMTIHLFIMQALVSTALYTRVKLGSGATAHQRLPLAELREHVFFLSQLFRGEFVFTPDGLDVNMERTLRGLAADGVLDVSRDASGAVECVALSQEERDSGRENYDFYCFLLWPFIENSWLGAVSLMMLTPPLGVTAGVVALDMKKVQEAAQVLGKTLYHQGDLSYFEAVNKETLKNGYDRFEEEGIVAVTKGNREAKTQTVVRLAPEWLPERCPDSGRLLPTGRLWQFAERISMSRREGKNRRDGKTVEHRVLKLVDMVGAALWDEALAKAAGPVADDGAPGADGQVRAARRRRKIGETTARL